MAAIASKRVIIETRELLYEPAVLQRVLSYAGLGHWFFIAAVSSLWRDLYSRLRPRMLQVYAPSGYKEEIICVAQMTLYSSVLQSASRVRLAHAHGLKFTKSFELAAGGYGTVEAVMAARELGLLLSSATAQGAAGCSNMSVLQFLRARDVCAWDSTAARAAARRGNLKVLQWLMEHGCHWNNGSILSEAASSGSLEMTAWVKQQPGVARNAQAMCEAACGGHTAVFEYMHAEQCPWNAAACDCAAYWGHVDTLRWLQEHGCPCDDLSVCLHAAKGGSVDVMLYLQQHEDIVLYAETLTEMLSAAGALLKLAAAQWLRQHGAEWPERLVYEGIAWPIELLRWAIAEGCTSPLE
jgi:hypothetical protein